MAKGRITMEKLREILRLKQECKLVNRAIGKAIGISHTAVGERLAACAERGIHYNMAALLPDSELQELLSAEKRDDDPRLKILHEKIDYILKELTRTGVTRHLLWEEYRIEHSGGYGYSQFCQHILQYKKDSKLEMHVDHKAGDKLFVDFTGERMEYVDLLTGEIIPVEIFVATLGASSFTYVEACANQKIPCFIQACSNVLHYIGGVPNAIVTDCLKSAVTKADRYESIINKTFADFGRHYGCAILPARPRKPKDKATVEGAVRIAYQQIFARLRNRTFHSIVQINQAMREELFAYNDRIMKGYGKSRHERFLELDKPVLRPLSTRYEVKEYQRCRAGAQYHVFLSCDKHSYSVPHEYRNRTMDVWYTASHVEIYCENRRIAMHPRSYKKYDFTTVKEHKHPNHLYLEQWNADKLIAREDVIGAYVRDCVEIILNRAEHPENGFRSCNGLLSLKSKYPNADINKACAHAIAIDSVTCTSVRNILTSRVHDHAQSNTDPVLTLPLPDHENIRGADYYTMELLN